MNNKKSPIDRLWDAFSSMKLGLALLGIIALAAALGTFFPQIGQQPERAETIGGFWQALGFTNLYGVWWFRLLLGLLGINLIICSIQRFQGIYSKTLRIRLPQHISELPGQTRLEFFEGSEKLVHTLSEHFRKNKYYLAMKALENGWAFTAVKRRWGYWGSFITHISFVVLLAGALIGSILGFKGYFMAGAGSTLPLQQIEISRGKINKNFDIKINSSEDRILPNGERDNWYTDLSIYEGNKEAARGILSVNHPFTYEGVTFYQADFAQGASLTVDLQGKNIPVLLRDRGGNYFNAPGTDLYLIVAGMMKDVKNPLILYQVYQGNNPRPVQTGQLAKGATEDIKGAYKITLNDYAGFTGLQVKEDPGVVLIWLGSALLLIGLILSFYWSPVVISGVFSEDKNGKLSVGASGKAKILVEEELKVFENILKN